MDDLSGFVLARLADDERRLEAGELPHLDEAERRGRLRIMRTNDQQGLLLVGGPVQTMEERVPIPFPERSHSSARKLSAGMTRLCSVWWRRCTTPTPTGGRTGGPEGDLR
jgi:hypothetical protein